MDSSICEAICYIGQQIDLCICDMNTITTYCNTIIEKLRIFVTIKPRNIKNMPDLNMDPRSVRNMAEANAIRFIG